MSFILTALIVAALMVGAYYLIHKLAPSWGTVGTNALGGVLVLAQQGLDVASSLPWGTVLEQAQAAAIAFGIMAANGIMRIVNGKKQPVGS
jgi:hypothetical protein